MKYFKSILLKLSLVCLLILLGLYSNNIFAISSIKNYAPKYGVTTENVNVRQGLSTSSKLLKTINKGTSIKMVAELNDFYIVQLSSNEVGAISKKYVKSSITSPKGASTYYSTAIKTAAIKEKSVNVRSGPGTKFKLISSLSLNSSVRVIGYIDDFYMVITQNDTVRND